MADPIPFKPRRPCPICSKPSQPKFHPFCSNRCAQVDLNRWLGGHYALPVVEDESQPGDDEQNAQDS